MGVIDSFLDNKKNKKYVELVTDRGNRGDFEVRVLANSKLHNMGQAKQIVKGSVLYYDLASQGKEKDFYKELKRKHMRLNKNSINTIKSVYKNYFDKTNIETKLMQSAMLNYNQGDFGAILDTTHLSYGDYVSIERKLKDAGINVNSQDFKSLNAKKFGSLNSIFRIKHAREKISSTEEFLGVLNKYKIFGKVRKNLINAIVSGDGQRVDDVLHGIKNEQIQNKVTYGALKYFNSMKGVSASNRKKIVELANINIRHKAMENEKNIFSLLGLGNISQQKQMNIISDWVKSPLKALNDINKERKKYHERAIDLNSLNRIQQIVNAKNDLGLTSKNNKKEIDFMYSASNMDAKTAKTVSLTLQKQTVDILNGSKKLLSEIRDSLKK